MDGPPPAPPTGSGGPVPFYRNADAANRSSANGGHARPGPHQVPYNPAAFMRPLAQQPVAANGHGLPPPPTDAWPQPRHHRPFKAVDGEDNVSRLRNLLMAAAVVLLAVLMSWLLKATPPAGTPLPAVHFATGGAASLLRPPGAHAPALTDPALVPPPPAEPAANFADFHPALQAATDAAARASAAEAAGFASSWPVRPTPPHHAFPPDPTPHPASAAGVSTDAGDAWRMPEFAPASRPLPPPLPPWEESVAPEAVAPVLVAQEAVVPESVGQESVTLREVPSSIAPPLPAVAPPEPPPADEIAEAATGTIDGAERGGAPPSPAPPDVAEAAAAVESVVESEVESVVESVVESAMESAVESAVESHAFAGIDTPREAEAAPTAATAAGAPAAAETPSPPPLDVPVIPPIPVVPVVPVVPVAPPACACKDPGPSAPGPACELTGLVNDCCCDYATVDALNAGTLHPLLSELTALPFFRYFRINLKCDCPLWPDDGMCFLRDCSVCECPPEEVPLPWRKDDLSPPVPGCAAPPADGGDPAAAVDRTLESDVLAGRDGWARPAAWSSGGDNDWTAEDEGDAATVRDSVYVNLVRNPEAYTGYKGEHAHRIWGAIYGQPCFAAGVADDVTERRVLYRLISGMHASITAHIAAKSPPPDGPPGAPVASYGPDVSVFASRLAPHPERLENLYFAFLFVLRAITRAGPSLAAADYGTGDAAADGHTRDLVIRLVTSAELRAACPVPFDEGRLWRGAGGAELQAELRASFRSVSSVMDCVGCEKCKLWGKLQVLGLATAIKVLSASDGLEPPKLALRRNDAIALVNLLARLSESVATVRAMASQVRDRGHAGGGGGGRRPGVLQGEGPLAAPRRSQPPAAPQSWLPVFGADRPLSRPPRAVAPSAAHAAAAPATAWGGAIPVAETLEGKEAAAAAGVDGGAGGGDARARVPPGLPRRWPPPPDGPPPVTGPAAAPRRV